MPPRIFQPGGSLPGPGAMPVFDQPNLIYHLPILKTKSKGGLRRSLAAMEGGRGGPATLSSAGSISPRRLVAGAQDQLRWSKAAWPPDARLGKFTPQTPGDQLFLTCMGAEAKRSKLLPGHPRPAPTRGESC